MRRPATQRCKCAVGEEVVGEKLAGHVCHSVVQGYNVGPDGATRAGRLRLAGWGDVNDADRDIAGFLFR